jgi:hypothetical protein
MDEDGQRRPRPLPSGERSSRASVVAVAFFVVHNRACESA